MALGNRFMSFELHYGPFPIDRPGWGHPDFDLADATVVERDLDCQTDAVRHLGAVNEAGQVVLAAGSRTDPWCGGDIITFDVRGTRGRMLMQGEEFATFNRGLEFFDPVADMDGDGLNDLLYQWEPLEKPIAGWYDFPPEAIDFEPRGRVEHLEGVPDVTGDGLADIVVEDWPEGAPGPTWYALHGTVRGLQIDPSRIGVPLILPEGAFAYAFTPVDLNADGLVELIFRNMYYGDSGILWIFDGADIAASMAELQ